MIWHVAMRAMRCAALRGVWIATDDERIAEAARALDLPCVMTAADHPSGTDRVREAANRLGLPQDAVVVNIQGDEPLLEPAMLDELLAPFADDGVQCATLATPLEPAADAALIASPNQVKVVTDLAGDALYFSRAPVPYPRDGTASRYLGHVGIYAFRRRVLERMSALPSSPPGTAGKAGTTAPSGKRHSHAGRRDFVPHLRRGHSGGSGGRPSRSCPSTRLISPETATRNIIMSQLATARRQLSSIKSLIRQEKFLSAVQTLRDAVITVFREPLMKAEKEEFERLISDASYHIVCDPHVRKAAALELKYVPGKEREFLDGLNMLLETFDGQFQDEARESARLLEEKRRQELERGQQKLDAGQVDAARARVFDSGAGKSGKL